jgi:ATP-dependent exoDNAse (exonuclease V) beta subunit
MMPDRLRQMDADARRLALSALDRTLLLEAGAGSGKTSVLAGRVLALLAAGCPPGSVAAITFTEVAASELQERVARFLDEATAGQVRPDLAPAFPGGLDVAQRARLETARERLDELTCTTIHGFCALLLRPYPVEAGMDPGAAVTDREASGLLFGEVFDTWLRERLSGQRRPGDLLVMLYLDDPAATAALLRLIAGRLLAHRDARVMACEMVAEPLGTVRLAVAALRAFLGEASCQEPETLAISEQLELLIAEAPGEGATEPEVLLHLLHLTAPEACAKKDGGFKAYQRKGKWEAAAKRGGTTKADAARLNDGAAGHYAACVAAHEAAKSYAAGRVVHLLAEELQEVLRRYAAAKRDAALLDFDDLLWKARDLLASSSAVRHAVGQRFRAVLVDEFQDTDPVQCEILWRLCGDPPPDAGADAAWTQWLLRPGALFLVGDPKQAIYRFRGADVASYVAARDVLSAADPGALVSIGRNFRSVAGILEWVNGSFAGPLGAEGQPGFGHLFTDLVHDAAAPVAALDVAVDEGAKADAIRDAEADAVAALCGRIIGALPVRGVAGPRPCQPDDIALLAPNGAELWRYERALEEQGIAVATQAGKGFFRRQEVQDLIALVRVLADGRDTLALGTLLRGPLVGLTEEALLDATAGLPVESDRMPVLRRDTPLADMADPLLRETLAMLQSLARLGRQTTPYVLLSQAVEELRVRPIVRARTSRTAERALANVDQFLELARPYDVRGLRAFAADMRAQWEEAQRALEARPDTEQQAVSLVTMHSAKGLEWPVVIPVNTASRVNTRLDAALDRDGVLHVPVLGCHPPGCATALEAERAELERERHRIWYVATTRARDLLLLPRLPFPSAASTWMGALDLQLPTLPAFDGSSLGQPHSYRTIEPVNGQDRATFVREAERIAARTRRIRRVTPHLAEIADEPSTELIILTGPEDALEALPTPRGGLRRGLVLHKLLEEVLTGECADEEGALLARATALAADLAADELECRELAAAVQRGLARPEIRAVRHKLLPEWTVLSSAHLDEMEHVTSGIADALAVEPDGTVSLVVDWKSDVAPALATVAQYRAQLRAYLEATGATEGLLVFLTTGTVVSVKGLE